MIRFGEDVCRNVDSALRREWLRDERDWRVCLGNNQRMQYTPVPRPSGRGDQAAGGPLGGTFWRRPVAICDTVAVVRSSEMGPENRKSGFPHARSSLHPLLLTHDVFFGELQSSRSLDGITLSHRIANSPPEEIEVHTHVEAHFVLVTSGRYVSSARATPNHRTTLVYNPPGTTHRDHFDQGKGSFFTISVSTERLAESSDSDLPSLALHLSNERACGLAKALLMECPRWDTSSSLKAESLYSELLAAALHRSPPAEQARPTWLCAARELIQDRYADNLSIRQVANAVGVHPTHLARVFRSFLGCTPGDLLRARRLERAAESLLLTDISIAEIALESGYSDQAQFTKAFRQTYGTPPGSYRRLSRRRPARLDVAF
jgi:AraC family transcriptional regulator